MIALDVGTGALRWKQSTREPGDSTAGSAVVLSGPVVVAGDYNLVAFDRATGAVRWRFAPPIGQAPGVYLGASTDEAVLAGSATGRLYSVSSAMGEVLWSRAIESDGRTAVFWPTTDGKTVAAGYTTFVAPNIGGVALFDLTTGRQLWRVAFPRASDPLLGTGSMGGPILAADVVIASSGDGRIYGFDRADGSTRWTLPPVDTLQPVLRGPWLPPAVTASADFRPLTHVGQLLFAGSLKGHVIAYDLATRQERWRYVDDRSGSVSFALSSDNQAVYAPYVSGRHVALDIATGRERWHTADAIDGFHWPASSDNRQVYLAGETGGYLAVAR